MKKLILCLLVFVMHDIVLAGGYNNFTTWRAWPLLRGQRGLYMQSIDNFFWSGFNENRRVWDLSSDTLNWPGKARVPSVFGRPRDLGVPPAPDSFPTAQIVELDTLSGIAVWTYLQQDTFTLRSNGWDQTQVGYRFLMVYTPRPGVEVYRFPMRFGDSWQGIWRARYVIQDPIYYELVEGHRKKIVGRGKVRVPFSGGKFWPCLIIMDRYTYTDNFGTNENRVIYEWTVPGRFSGGNGVAAVMGLNGADSNFVVVDRMFLLRNITASDTITGRPWNFYTPDFSGTTVWRDTNNFAGPFVVSSTITDTARYSGGIGADSLFYNLRPGDPDTLYRGVGHDSIRGNVYYFSIPRISQPETIRYFIWAADSFSVAKNINVWNTDPIAAPENTTFKFFARPPGGGISKEKFIAPPIFAELKQNSPNPFISETQILYQIPREGKITLKIYNAGGQLVKKLVDEIKHAGYYQAKWDGRDENNKKVSSGVYFYFLRTEHFSQNKRMILLR